MNQANVPETLLAGNILTDALLTAARPSTAACTKNTYGRGAGDALSACPAHKEKSGALCYDKCPQDWEYGAYGVAHVCYQVGYVCMHLPDTYRAGLILPCGEHNLQHQCQWRT
jgi:hypothetical protein